MSGTTIINGFFGVWVKKGSVIGEELSHSIEYYRVFKNVDEGLGNLDAEIYAYDGEGDTDWVWDESDNLLPNIRSVCKLVADLSGLRGFLKVERGSDGQEFWKVTFYVKIFFGGTALKARLAWYEGVSISHFHPHVTDIWLCLSGNPARRPCPRYSELGLLSIIRGWEA